MTTGISENHNPNMRRYTILKGQNFIIYGGKEILVIPFNKAQR